MQVQVARISPVVVELAVEVTADAVTAEVDKAYASLQKKARVRGFRPGKAPRQVLTHLYGSQVTSDVVKAIVNETLPKALSEKQVQPVNQPQVEAGKLEPGAVFSYKARFEVPPEIADVVYEGLELVRPSVDATPQMVDEQIELLRGQHARLQASESPRAARKGDVVTIDFTLAVAGKELKDGGGQGVQLELGSGQILAELDAALVGKNVDDSFEVEATFADVHARPELRGKSAVFHVNVKDIKERLLPAVDDELAKDVGAFETLVELRADVHTRLEKMLKDRADAAVAEQIVAKLNEKNPIDLPPSLVEQQCRIMEMAVLQNARRAGQRPTTQDLETVHAQVHADAEKKVRAGLLMAVIAKKLGLEVDANDIQRGIEELAGETGKNVAKVRAEYADPQRRQMLLGMLLEDKVLTAIEGVAKIVSETKGDVADAGAPQAASQSKGHATPPKGKDTKADSEAEISAEARR